MTDVALREIRYGRVWRANALRLVEEHEGCLVLWSPAGIPRKLPLAGDGSEIRLPCAEWRLGERATVWEALGFVYARRPYSLWLHWAPDRRFSHWYVNLEQPLGRTAVGWDYVDDKLDLVVAPDGAVTWKDEDELEQADRLGLLDAACVRAAAERVLADPPWPTGREDWLPNPSWPVPALPPGWDVV